MTKRTLLIFMIFCLLASSTSFALTEKIVTESNAKFSNINYFLNSFDITSGKAKFSSKIEARNCDSVKITVLLQQYNSGNWKTIKSWSEKADKHYLTMAKSWYVMSGHKYRTKSYCYVYADGNIVDNSSMMSKEIKY